MKNPKKAIRIEDFNCRYGANNALRLTHINLEVNLGEFTAIVGPSGGGKSTLAFSINGIIPHEIEGSETSGEIWLLDLQVKKHPTYELVKAVGTVLQDPEWQLVTFTIADEIAFGLENLGVPVEEIKKRISNLAPLLKLENLLDRSTDELSGGQKQRVAIASCLAMEPPILLLDEPMAELDPAGKVTVMETVVSLNRDYGVTVIFIDHNLDVIAPYADQVVVIADGKIINRGSARDIFADPKIFEITRLRPPQVMEIAAFLPKELIHSPHPPLSVKELVETLRPEIVNHLRINQEEGIKTSIGDNPIVAKVENLRFRYPDGPEAIRGVDLSIFRQDFIGLIGQNGAGKSSLAKLLTGLLSPTNGKVYLSDHLISSMGREEIATHIGYVFQNPDVQFFSRTCFDEVAFGLRLRKVPEKEIHTRVEHVLNQLDLLRYRDEHPHFLSRGERRRVAIASVLVFEPQIIILDEPTTGLDTGTATRMLEILRELHQRGHTIVVLTHEMRAVLEFCNRLVLVNQGQVILDEDPRQAFWNKELLVSCNIYVPPIAELITSLPWETQPLLPKTSKEAADMLVNALDLQSELNRRKNETSHPWS